MKSILCYLDIVKKNDLYRETIEYEPIDSTHVMVNGQACLMLASNNYLGLTHHEQVKQVAIDAVIAYGTGSGGARLTTGTHPLYKLLEEELASFKGTESAVVFNTGYMANVGTITALAGKNDVIFSDELNHASIIDGCRMSKASTVVYQHNNMDQLKECLATTNCTGRRLIVTDGVFSMDGDIAPLDEIVELAEQYEAMVMVDDAHALGVIGLGGRGTVSYFGLEGRVAVQMGTLSKSLGSEGGYVAGSTKLINYLKNKSRSFIFSTALSPATIAAAYAALEMLRNHPDLVTKLLDNTCYLRTKLIEGGWKVGKGITPILPILVGEASAANHLALELKSAGLIISAIRPPTVPAGTSRLRITVSAAHNKLELSEAAIKINSAGRKMGLLL